MINKYHTISPNQQHSPAIQLCLAVAIAVLFVTTPVAASHVSAQEEIIHTVRSGESLSSIAARYGVSVSAVARHNGIRNINLLRVGQVLRIPGATIVQAPTSVPTPQPPATGASNDSITQPTSTPMPIATPYVYKDDSPAATPTPLVPTPVPLVTIRIHVVAAFDTLTGIANFYGTSVWAIKSRNGLSSDRIHRGQRLIIP